MLCARVMLPPFDTGDVCQCFHQGRNIEQRLQTHRTAHYRCSMHPSRLLNRLDWATSPVMGTLLPARTQRQSRSHSICRFYSYIYIPDIDVCLSHSIFVIDRQAGVLCEIPPNANHCVLSRSGSMSLGDRQPLPNTPVTARIAATCSNRLGAVYSSLYAFWLSRQNILNQSYSQHASSRRDAYSVLLFDHEVISCLENDFVSAADQLLNAVLAHPSRGGTDYTAALKAAQAVMTAYWSSERYWLHLSRPGTNGSQFRQGPRSSSSFRTVNAQ
jgi:hypothetical protein